MSGLSSLILYGFVLGWSVAWPPGPINAEMMRRAVARGFGAAIAVGLGACSGDALWAIAVALGASALVGSGAKFALALVSAALLLALAAIFLAGAWRGWQAWRRGAVPATSARAPTARVGYLLGLTMALTGPWNMAFWLAVIGRPESQRAGLGGALVVAAAVILGAALWCLVLCTATARLRRRLAGALWDVVAKGATGILMLGFAAHGALTLTAG